MNRALNKLLIATAAFAVLSPVMASERGTPEEATALVKKTIAYYKANGADKTFAAINSQSPDFKTKDIYIFGSITKDNQPLAAHGANPRMVGKNMTALKDADGQPFAAKIVEVARSKEGKGWVDYKWPNPKTGAIEPKTTYVERVDDVYFAAGIYK